MRTPCPVNQSGTSLVEVLVAMVVLAIGLLGLVGLQARLHSLQVESYQRAQALMLLNDMASRIALNRNDAAAYVTDAVAGVANPDCPTDTSDRANADLVEWCNALQGAAETNGGNVGAMVGGRGCIEQPDPAVTEFRITVAWQGLTPVSAPPEAITCGQDLYGAAGSICEGDVCRRFVTTLVRISTLD
jgi:type IV pilus assembly protein PilV